MEWIDKMSAAMDYIENNLTDEIDFEIVARIAGTSSYNFQRMFSFITDSSLAEYIRRRRMTLAGIELTNTSQSILEIAIKYGYDSATSFARTFKTIHGVTPSEARHDGAKLKAFPKITFIISIKGDKEMDYRIETKEAFEVFGIEAVCSLTDEKGMKPHELWQQCQADGTYEKLFEDAGSLPDGMPQNICRIHAALNYRKTGENTFSYLLCSFVSKDSKTKGYHMAHIPSQTYAIFPSETFRWDEDFNKVLDDLHRKFYSEWLPTSCYDEVDGPQFEIYGGTEEYGYIELWYPVKKR